MKRKKFKDLNLSDSFLFAAALQKPDICRIVLEIIFGREIPEVKVHTEHTVLFSSDFRSIRLDVYASSKMEVSYNIESQNKRNRNLAKRSRFHQAEMDVTSLKPGEDFDDLKPGYVVFICTFDPFGKGRYQYTFEERCLEEELALGDETKKIFLNSKGKNEAETSPALVQFLKYMENSTKQCAEQTGESVIEELHDRITALKKSRDLEAKYMTLGEWMDEEAAIEKEAGRAEGRAESILDLLCLKGAVPTEMKEKIFLEKDPERLKEWFHMAALSDNINDFVEKMKL